jgi:hypothetical protein
MPKLYDLAVAVGSYTNKAGEEKKRWKNIGSVVQTKDGGKVILIDRTFNPAGVDVEPGRDQIMISMFEPKDENGQQQGQQRQAPRQQQQGGGGFNDMTDDIPF